MNRPARNIVRGSVGSGMSVTSAAARAASMSGRSTGGTQLSATVASFQRARRRDTTRDRKAGSLHDRASLNAQQLCRGAAEDRDALLIGETGCGHHQLDLGAGPGERIVGPDQNPIGTGLGDQMAQRLGGKDDGVEVELAVAQIGGGLLFRQRADAIRKAADHGIGAIGVGRQEAAAGGGADLEAGEAVERALIDQMRQRDGGLERIADRVGEEAAATEAAGWFQLARAERVHEDQHAEFLALRPEWMEARIGELLAGDAAADA